ncbi:hypothetical protein [Pseudomonas carnis]|uniref:hypothetical protein n=3 Tax=Bacteria TaxID=2 RepID=UPI0018E86BF2|nr:hypothetical protein [Pseudomonas carnis]MBJ2204933.1 hypothetical protein [Pseudomonas carnis]
MNFDEHFRENIKKLFFDDIALTAKEWSSQKNITYNDAVESVVDAVLRGDQSLGFGLDLESMKENLDSFEDNDDLPELSSEVREQLDETYKEDCVRQAICLIIEDDADPEYEFDASDIENWGIPESKEILALIAELLELPYDLALKRYNERMVKEGRTDLMYT